MHKWLIIGGTTRSGTTSTYYYLGDHPAICAATIKETGYFLGEDNLLPRPHRYHPSLDGYANLFPCSGADQIWMEATPHYLYSEGTAERLCKANPQARVVFLLREPISRLVSWHRFAMSKGLVLRRMTFAEFVAAQHQHPTVHTPFALRAMEEGRYARYLARWLAVLPRDQIMIVKYSDISRDPRDVMQKIAAFAGIDAGFYDSYSFEIQNASYEVRSTLVGKVYHAFQWRTRWAVRNSPMRVRIREFESRVVRPVFMRLNSQPQKTTEIPDEVRARLETYYQDEPQQIAQVLGLDEWRW